MDKQEIKVIGITIGVMVLFMATLFVAARSSKKLNIPECLPYEGNAFSKAQVKKVADNYYQIFVVAGMWNFTLDDDLGNSIDLPLGAEVDFFLTSKDVMHTFSLKDKGISMMAAYGGVNKKSVVFDRPGVYKIVCSEYCGAGHQGMNASITVK